MLQRRVSCGCKLFSVGISKHYSNLIVQSENKKDSDLLTDSFDRIPFEKKSVLEVCEEDISHVAPYLKPTFNFAAYVNKSVTLQELLKLGVNLHKLEKKVTVPPYILGLDFEKDIKNHVIFLHEAGLNVGTIGNIITKNPFIFKESLEDLEIRINYLKSKKFVDDMIVRILTVNPYWLMFSTQRIDRRLGFFQKQFELSGDHVRQLTIQQPKLITYSLQHIKTNTFVLREEMGFSMEETKNILLKKPIIFMKSQEKSLETFEYLHKDMKISLEMLSQLPEVLTCRLFRLKQRHTFLEKLGKAQYNPKHTGYVSILTLVSGNDLDFCKNVCKCPLETFNTFLKSM